MSRHYSSFSQRARQLGSDIEKNSTEYAYNAYGIVIDEETGAVFDSTTNLRYGNIGEWIMFTVEQEELIEHQEQMYSHKHDDWD